MTDNPTKRKRTRSRPRKRRAYNLAADLGVTAEQLNDLLYQAAQPKDFAVTTPDAGRWEGRYWTPNFEMYRNGVRGGPQGQYRPQANHPPR
jgi:hypothetical protein